MKTLFLLLLSCTMCGQVATDSVDYVRPKKDYWKAPAVVLFFESWGELLVVPTLPTDKAAHFALSQVGSGLATYGYSKVVKNKWLAAGLGAGTVVTLGFLKEQIDPHIGGVKSREDQVMNILGALSGAIKVRVVLK